VIDAYVVRDPQGTVIGLSLTSYTSALDDAMRDEQLPLAAYRALEKGCENEGAGEYRGYTIRREQVAL
jgi:hypothetical protein